MPHPFAGVAEYGHPTQFLFDDEPRLDADEELVYALYEMTVDSFPSFRCAAVFPKKVLGASSPETTGTW